MWYALWCEDTPDSLSGRQAARPAHLARLNALKDEGRLLLAGPLPAIDSPDPGPNPKVWRQCDPGAGTPQTFQKVFKCLG